MHDLKSLLIGLKIRFIIPLPKLALAYYDSGEIEKAVTSFKKLVRFDSRFKVSSLDKGVLGLYPENAELHDKLGCWYADCGDYDRAVIHLMEAVKLDTKYKLSYLI